MAEIWQGKWQGRDMAKPQSNLEGIVGFWFSTKKGGRSPTSRIVGVDAFDPNVSIYEVLW